MKLRFTLFRRGRTFYCQDTTTGRQSSLRTKEEAEARTILNAKNEAFRQPTLNLQIARTYLSATDPEIAKRTWRAVMDEMATTKRGVTLRRHQSAMKNAALFDPRDADLGNPAHAFHARIGGRVRLDEHLPAPAAQLRVGDQLAAVADFAEKVLAKDRLQREAGGDGEEHRTIVANEHNPERRAYYECCWHLGGSQTDVANLKAEDVDWDSRVVGFHRQKTGSVSLIRFGVELEGVLKTLPRLGPLFPKHRLLTEGRRAKEFWRACRRMKIAGISLHSYLCLGRTGAVVRLS